MINFNDLPDDIMQIIFKNNRIDALNKKYKRDFNEVINTLNEINKIINKNEEYINKIIINEFNINYDLILTQMYNNNFYIEYDYYDTFFADHFMPSEFGAETFRNDDEYYDNFTALRIILNNFMMILKK